MMCTGSPTVYYNCVLPILFSKFILGKWSKSQGGKCSKSEKQTCRYGKKRKIDGIAQLQKFKCNNYNFHMEKFQFLLHNTMNVETFKSILLLPTKVILVLCFLTFYSYFILIFFCFQRRFRHLSSVFYCLK